MKNKFIITLALFVSISPTISMQTEQPIPQSKATQSWSDWARTKSSNLWQAGSQKLSQARNYAAGFIPESIKNTVSKWSAQKQIAVASAIVGALALAGYNKDTLMQTLSDAWSNTINLASQNPQMTTTIGAGTVIGTSLIGKSMISKAKQRELEQQKLARRELVRKTGVSEFYTEPKKNRQAELEHKKILAAKEKRETEQKNYLQKIINNKLFGEEYSKKATEICHADYTTIEKNGLPNLCVSLKKNLTNPSNILDPTLKGYIPHIPTEDDIKQSIDMLYKKLQKYKLNNLVQ